jgi:hypothetical protein
LQKLRPRSILPPRIGAGRRYGRNVTEGNKTETSPQGESEID